jgi:hypothetical protein
MPRAAHAALALALSTFGCMIHAATPARAPVDATGGHAPPWFDPTRACAAWSDAVGAGASEAMTHISFPEADPANSCYVPVRYDGASAPRPGAIPAGCGYPLGYALAPTEDALAARADLYDALVRGQATESLPLELACTLPDDVRRASAAVNARTARALAARVAHHAPFPYAAVSTFGYGFADQSRSVLVPFRPGASCPDVSDRELALFSVNYLRAERAAEAFHAGVAPVVIVSGGAIHSRLTEAFLLDYLLTCRFAVPEDAILVDPCADHTHTNLRNTGALVLAIGGRTAYVVTDDFLQSRYLEEWTPFDLIWGSIDQRALRDFGYLLGSHRRASVGMKSGFWYTPFRFWAEPAQGLGGFTCIPAALPVREVRERARDVIRNEPRNEP